MGAWPPPHAFAAASSLAEQSPTTSTGGRMRWGRPPAKEPDLLRHPWGTPAAQPRPHEGPSPLPGGLQAAGSRVWPKLPCLDSALHTPGWPRRGGGRAPGRARRAGRKVVSRGSRTWGSQSQCDFPPRPGAAPSAGMRPDVSPSAGLTAGWSQVVAPGAEEVAGGACVYTCARVCMVRVHTHAQPEDCTGRSSWRPLEASTRGPGRAAGGDGTPALRERQGAASPRAGGALPGLPGGRRVTLHLCRKSGPTLVRWQWWPGQAGAPRPRSGGVHRTRQTCPLPGAAGTRGAVLHRTLELLCPQEAALTRSLGRDLGRHGVCS